MAAPVLYDTQVRFKSEIEAKIARGARSVLCQAATGFGKSIVLASLVLDAIERGERVLILTHQRHLVAQIEQHLFQAGIDAGVILAGRSARPDQQVQIASIPTVHRRAIQSSKMDLPPADLVIVDECHHIRAKSWDDIVRSYPDAVLLGFSATPNRADGRGLGNVFEEMVCAPSVAELTRQGRLVPATFYAPSEPDLKGIRKTGGDFNKRQLGERVNTPQLVGDFVTHYLRLARDRKAIAYAVDRAHALHVCRELQLVGIAAEYLDGDTPIDERDGILRRLASGETRVVCNCGVLLEGFDCPDVDCIGILRPTESLPLYLQMIGRGLRSAPGKTDCLILDHSGAVYRHGLPTDDIRWSLDKDRRTVNRTQASRSRSTGKTLTNCPECAAIRMAGDPCRSCGWKPTRRPEAVSVHDGDLARVDRNRRTKPCEYSKADRARWHRQLVHIAKERGYKIGWAAYKHKEKFGQWPPRGKVQPEPPSPEVLSWVRSRNIAWAKSRSRR